MSERRALGLFVRLLGYYAVLAAAAWLVARWFPRGGPLFADRSPGSAAVAMLGALALVAPVATLYMRTKPKLRYDPSLVQTVIVLPIVIAGVVIGCAFALIALIALAMFILCFTPAPIRPMELIGR